jgi:5-methylcytosine-specific restriction endonuclease McrA
LIRFFGAKKPKVSRSPRWRALQKKWLSLHPRCAACGENKKLTVHHKIPVHWDPSKELDETNLITLCEQSSHNDHLIFGHLLDWKSRNPAAEEDANQYLREKSARPYP